MSPTTVFTLCEQAIGLVRGKRLILSGDELTALLGLDYDLLTRLHAQDEACVCALHFERVRDRLLQIYPWMFARRHKAYGNIYANESRELPDGFLTMLCVLKDEKPIEYDIAVKNIVPGDADEIIYTYQVKDVTQWPPIFCDVFCYSLAVEICSAVTGNPEYAKLLEQKAQELIQRAYQIGAIKADFPVTLKEEIYNRAMSLAHGQRTLKPESAGAYEQGTDNYGDLNSRRREEIAACERASESVRDRLLELYAWKFARKSVNLNTSAGNIQGWDHDYILPEDCLKVLSIISDGEAVDYEECKNEIYCNAYCPTLRYTARITDIEKWPGAFKDVYVCYLAQEIILATTNNLESIQLLEARAENLIQRAITSGAIRGETEIPPKEALFRRAISLSHGTRVINPTGKTSGEQGTDITGDINYYAREEIAICKRSYEYHRDSLLKLYGWRFARKTAALTLSTKLSGWNYAYVLPSDCVKVLCVLSGDEPVEYEESDGKILCDYGNVSLRYTRRVSEIADFDDVFREVLCCRLASEIITGTRYNAELLQILEQKVQSLIRDAYRTGIIHEETHITLKEELYRRAIKLSEGQRTLKTSSETAITNGIDDGGELNARLQRANEICRLSSESVRDKLLGLYAWTFAKKSENPKLAGTSSGWTNGYELPSDCLTVLTVLKSGEPVDYEVSDGKVYCNGTDIELRYTARISAMSEWPGLFKDAFCYGLAEEICASSFGASELITQLEQRLQQIITDAYKTGVIKTETRIPMKRELFNRAIGLVKGMKTEKIDILDTRYQDEVSVCYRSYETLRDRLLQLYEWVFARKTEIPAQLSESVPGWKYTYMLPEDCLKVLSVIAEDKRSGYGQEKNCRSVSELSGKVEILDYETAGNELYANHAPVYVRYTARIANESDWAASFKDALVILIAIEICHNVTEGLKLIQILEQRLAGIIENAHLSGLIRPETRLPLLRDSRYRGAREVPYLDYSGIPTMPCTPLDYCCGGIYERLSGEFCVR